MGHYELIVPQAYPIIWIFPFDLVRLLYADDIVHLTRMMIAAMMLFAFSFYLERSNIL